MFPSVFFQPVTLPPKDVGRFGNAGVGILRGPGTIAVAGGLPNHPNFAAPEFFADRPGSFGKIFSVQGQENSGNRVGQVGARLDW
ncbi:MAG TPA: hypothetical protein VLE22_17665 [Bryobacteraceae bacterium]|nr:hypothetical protein [Bryobacteraceae bacterium]